MRRAHIFLVIVLASFGFLFGRSRRQQAFLREAMAQEESYHDREEAYEAAQKKEDALRSVRARVWAQRAEHIASWEKLEKAHEKEDAVDGAFAHLYTVPNWELPGQYGYDKNLLSVKYQYKTATHGFDRDGYRDDVSIVTLKNSEPLLEDILLASKLANRDSEYLVAKDNDNYLAYLSEMPLKFSARHTSFDTTIGYARSFLNNLVTVGCQIPFSTKSHVVTIEPTLTNAMWEQIRRREQGAVKNSFREKYGVDPVNFFKDILRLRDRPYKERLRSVGISSFDLFFHIAPTTPVAERFLVGASLSIPYKETSTHRYFYHPQASNEFNSISCFVGLQRSFANWCNPHVFLKGVYSIPAITKRYVSPKRSLTARASGDRSGEITMGDQIKADQVIEGVETMAPFSADQLSLKIAPGYLFVARLGNTIERFLDRKAALDLSYQLSYQSPERFSGHLVTDKWDTTVFDDTVRTLAHEVSGTMRYQHSAHAHFVAGGSVTFAGRQIGQDIGLFGQFIYQF